MTVDEFKIGFRMLLREFNDSNNCNVIGFSPKFEIVEISLEREIVTLNDIIITIK